MSEKSNNEDGEKSERNNDEEKLAQLDKDELEKIADEDQNDLKLLKDVSIYSNKLQFIKLFLGTVFYTFTLHLFRRCITGLI
jgi:hypothetical protein